MTVDFPIRVDIQNAMFGAMLASLPYRPQFARQAAAMFGMDSTSGTHDPQAGLDFQEGLYHRTVDQLRNIRRVLGAPAGGDDIYSLPWFLLSFHGWMAIAELSGLEKIGWLRANDDLSMLQRCLFELGIAADADEMRARLTRLASSESQPGDMAAVDFANYSFLEQARYLSSAAIRNGHRVGLHVPTQRVFISYAHRDSEFVDGLATFLEAHAVRVWYDTSDLKSGVVLDERLRREIGQAECLVAVLTDGSLQSRYVALEVAAALGQDKSVLPLSLLPISALQGRTWPDGRDVYSEISRYPIVDASASSPIEAYENVLRSLQRSEADLTRWKQDEGSHLSLFRDKLGAR